MRFHSRLAPIALVPICMLGALFGCEGVTTTIAEVDDSGQPSQSSASSTSAASTSQSSTATCSQSLQCATPTISQLDGTSYTGLGATWSCSDGHTYTAECFCFSSDAGPDAGSGSCKCIVDEARCDALGCNSSPASASCAKAGCLGVQPTDFAGCPGPSDSDVLSACGFPR